MRALTAVTTLFGLYADIHGLRFSSGLRDASRFLKRINMQHRISEFLVGLLFGLGLILSGMTDPGKVIGFLDIFGAWDPSLALVMAGAIAVGFFAFAFAKKRTANFLGGALHLPKSNQIDKPLVIGAVLFGAGWGLAGFCPGPGLVSMASGQFKGAVFVLFMVAGMQLFEMFSRRLSQPK
jgi:uncharacterized membrane protein YedE/YeeE